MRRRVFVILIALLLIISGTFMSCRNNTTSESSDSMSSDPVSEPEVSQDTENGQTEVDSGTDTTFPSTESSDSGGTFTEGSTGNPYILFGNNIEESGMTYSVEGSSYLSTGRILGKEYVKLDKKEVTLRFSLNQAYQKKFTGKSLFVIIEYYESNSREYEFTYHSGKVETVQSFAMAGTTAWGGKTIRIADYRPGNSDTYDFSLKLSTSSQMWIRSVSVKEAVAVRTVYPQVIKTTYTSSNGRIISANVRDYGAVGNGAEDDSIAFQTALSDMAALGGTLYVPSGTYKLTQEMEIPNGVTILGDFNAPSESSAKVSGTVLALYPISSDEGNSRNFFTLRKGSCFRGFTVWYPKQDMKSGEPIRYPYTLGIADSIGTNMEDIYLVNSYLGITHKNGDAFHSQQIMKNIYGTPLYMGYYAGWANDVDRLENIHFSPDYWLGSGLAGIPDRAVLSRWIMANGTAFSLGNIDWHFVSDLNIKGYKTGLYIRSFYGKVYNFTITDCNTCVYIENVIMYGGQLTNGVLKANGGENPAALRVGAAVNEGFTANALVMESTGSYALEYLGTGSMSLQDSSIKVTGMNSKAGLYNAGGNISVSNTVFSGGARNAVFGKASNSSMVNCTASIGRFTYLSEGSGNVRVVSDAGSNTKGLNLQELAVRDSVRAFQTRLPAQLTLYSIAGFGVKAPDEKADISRQLQQAIDAAYAAGGGIVYVPKGAYRLERPITVRSGVELQGSTDYSHYVKIETTVFLTDYGKGTPQAQPLITIEKDAGVRGFNIIYDKVTQETIQPYATTIQGKGKNVYIMNVTAVGGWFVADLQTYRCDNHYIEGVHFVTFKTGIAVGGESRNGAILNTHSNPGELWDNGYNSYNWSKNLEGALQLYLTANVTGFLIGNTKSEVLYMTFIFGAQNGILIGDGADVYVIGHGSDFSRVGIRITGNSNSVILDPQLVGSNQSAPYTSTAVVADSGFTGVTSLFNVCTWNIRDATVRVDNGTVYLNGGTFLHSGLAAMIASKGRVTMAGVLTYTRSRADMWILSDVESACAFGNVALTNLRFEVAAGVRKSGADLQ